MSPPEGTPLVRPLNYSRSREIIEALKRLEPLPPRLWLRRLASLPPEALVTLARHFWEQERYEEGWKVVDALLPEMDSKIRRVLLAWHLTPDERDEVKAEAVLKVLDGLKAKTPSADFWECNFHTCVKRIVLNLMEDLIERKRHEAEQYQKAQDGDEWDRLENTADWRMSVLDAVAIQRIKAGLPPDLLKVFVMKYELEMKTESKDPDEPTIARSLKKTGRTVRNWLARLDAYLAEWKEG